MVLWAAAVTALVVVANVVLHYIEHRIIKSLQDRKPR